MLPPEQALHRVRDRIAEACRLAGRSPGSVTLVAVSKAVEPERVRQFLACGQRLFGENRVQEALRKIPRVGPPARWHLVGHLQKNKARHAVEGFELVHSVDGAELAREIHRRAERAGKIQPVLVQVNLSGEKTKHGLDEESLGPLLDSVLKLDSLDLRGFMTIPPPVEQAEESRPWFSRLRDLRDRMEERAGRPLPELSMGMSHDFEVAIEEGATMVRVGTALFGKRPVPAES